MVKCPSSQRYAIAAHAHSNGTKPASPRLGDTALAVACKRLAQKHGNDDNTEARKISSHLSMSMVWGARAPVAGPFSEKQARAERRRLVPLHYFAGDLAGATRGHGLGVNSETRTCRRCRSHHSASRRRPSGLLLVFRTNQAASRVHDARRLLGVVKTRGIDACATLWVAATDDNAKEAAKVRDGLFGPHAGPKGAVRPNHDAAIRGGPGDVSG